MARRFIQLILNKNSSFQTMLYELALRLYALCAKIDFRVLVQVLIALKGRLCYINKKRAENGNICYFLGGGTFVSLFNDIVIPERRPG